jgi:NTE family protein
MGSTTKPTGKRIALVLQGGGALGAYQAGIYQALEEHGLAPDWIAGASIGAINGAIIAGNPVGRRLDRLHEFWHTVALPDLWGAGYLPQAGRQIHSAWSFMAAALTGRPGFFTPRWPSALHPLNGGSPETASYYDTAPLRRLLERLVDFDTLNADTLRLSVGVVNVTTAKPRYFDNRAERLGPEHIMASAALPPAFPAVRIDRELYWDGGIYSNTPLEVVLDVHPRVNTLCFMAALFNPAGPEPRSLPEVEARHKDIIYGTRFERHIETYCRLHHLRRAVMALYERLPREARRDPEVRALAELGCHTTMELVPLIYAARDWELAHKDADFSHTAIEERWAQGYRDASRALEQAPWLQPAPPLAGVVVHHIAPEGEGSPISKSGCGCSGAQHSEQN